LYGTPFFESYVRDTFEKFDIQGCHDTPHDGDMDFIFDWALVCPEKSRVYWEYHIIKNMDKILSYKDIDKLIKIMTQVLKSSEDLKSIIFEKFYLAGNAKICNELHKRGIEPWAKSVKEKYYKPSLDVFMRCSFLVNDIKNEVSKFILS
jgi:hypothetical protein